MSFNWFIRELIGKHSALNKLRAIFFLSVKVKDYDVVFEGKNFFFYQPVQSDLITYENIQKIGIDQANDSTTGCLQNYSFF